MQTRWLLGGLSLALLCAGPVVAEQEKASKAAKRVAKNMQKLKSYRVNASVRGGMAQGADHKLTNTRVSNHYVADVVGGVMKVERPQRAFRTRMGGEGAGAIQSGRIWKGILSTEEGRQMARLFRMPKHHLMTVQKYAKLGKWVPVDPASVPAPSAAPAEPAADEDAKRTRVRNGKRSKSKSRGDDGPISNRMIIECPTTEAVEHFTTIVNSGCLGGG